MRVLVMAGSYTNRLVGKANAKYQNTLDVEGLEYLDEIDSYINRGGDFDRVVIFSKCYTRDGQVSDFESIIGSIIEFTNNVGSRVPNYELILVVDDKEVGLAAVKATLGMRDRTTVIYKEARSLSSAALYKLVADARHTLSSNFEILDLEDVKNNSSYVANSFEDETDTFGPAEVGTVDSHGAGDWGLGNPDDDWGTSGSTGWGSSDDWENEGNTSDGWDSAADPFGDTPEREKSLQDVNVGDIDNPFEKQFGGSDPFADSDGLGSNGSDLGGNGFTDDPFASSSTEDPFEEPLTNDGLGSEARESNESIEDDPFATSNSSESSWNGEDTTWTDGENTWSGGGNNSYGNELRDESEKFESDPFATVDSSEFVGNDPFRHEEEQLTSNAYTTHGDVSDDPFASGNIPSSNNYTDLFDGESKQFNDPFTSENGQSSNSYNDPFSGNDLESESREENSSEESISGSISDFEDEAYEEIPRASNNSESHQFEDPFGSTNTNSFSDFDEPENEPIRSSKSSRASNNFADDFEDEFNDGFEEVQRGPRNSSSRGVSMNSSAVELFEDENELDGTENMVADIEDEEPEAPQQRGRRGRKNKSTKNVAQARQPKSLPGNKMGKLKERLEVFKRNGCIITVTGGAGAGKTTVSANIANMLCKMGYSILVVDMDTEGRGQSSITFDNFSTINSSGLETSGVRAALASTVDRTGRFVNIIRPGFHLLGTGIKVDKISPKECLEAKNVNRLLHQWQNNYNFIIIDIPFDLAVEEFADMVTIANYVIMVEKMSSSGAMNLMIDMMNIQEEDVTDLMFEKAKILFNMEDNCTSILGKKVSSTSQVLNAIDIRLSQLLGHQVPYSFEEMQVIGCMKYSRQADACWFTKKYYTDIAEGNQVFSDILCGIFEV